MDLFTLSSVTKDDLQSLIDNKVFENKELDYKAYKMADGVMDSKNKDGLAQEIAAFANADGGFIIIGIAEDDDKVPNELVGTGMELKDYDKWLSTCRQLLMSRIRPHLHGVDYKPIELDDGTIAIIISIPKSFSRPHSYWDGNKDHFYIRYANGKSNMDIDDLRKQFLFSNSVQSQIKQFRADRISMILANDTVGDIGDDAKLILHLIPQWSFEIGNRVNFNRVVRHAFEPMSGSGCNYSYNSDGYVAYDSDNYGETDSYVQLFHNGIIEAVEIRLVSKYEEKRIYEWGAMQHVIIKAIAKYSLLLKEIGVPQPWHIYATILNARGYKTYNGLGQASGILNRDIIHSIDSTWKDEQTIDEVLKPVLDSLSNAFGFPYSSCYDAEDNLKQPFRP